MKRTRSVALAASMIAASGTDAAMIGVTATNYEVVDGIRRFSVMDVFVQCSGANDALLSYYGTSAFDSLVRTQRNGLYNSRTALVAGNGAPFAQAAGSDWMPSGQGGNAWDSFVTIGGRTQDAVAGVVADASFLNAGTPGAEVVAGGTDSLGLYKGAGWYTNAPSGSLASAGAYGDLRIMLGRFTLETTSLPATDVVRLQFKGNVTMMVEGTEVQSSFHETFTYGFVPSPGAAALLGLAGAIRRRRR